MMLKFKQVFLALAGATTLAAGAVSAGTVVHELDNGDLMVINYQGKPPHKRQIIEAGDNVDYARYKAMEDSVLVATATTSRRVGAPGKSLPRQQARFERVPEDQISSIARFEERESATDTRRWRGAPGKGRRF